MQVEGVNGRVNGWELELQGDAFGHRYIVDALRRARPDDAILSEEGVDDLVRVGNDRVWIVDPLDGSSGFGRGNDEWAVHVALSVHGKATVGAVAVPGLSITGRTGFPQEPAPRIAREPIVVSGRSRGWLEGQQVANTLGGQLLQCSSAGVKAMLVATGVADVYVHDAPLYEWDVCAPVAVAKAAGLHVSDTTGTELIFNKAEPVVRSVLISQVDLAGDVIEMFSF